MPNDSTSPRRRQGFASGSAERLPLPPMEALTAEQRQAAEQLIAGPRKGVYGPFLPLLRSPVLLERVAKVGEYLRFDSVLPVRVRELATCAVARHVGNQFEWLMHAPLALKAGVSQSTLDALREGARPRHLETEEEAALDFTQELLLRNGSSDTTYAAVRDQFGEQGVVELATLVGYFAMVSWLMNVARTPPQSTAAEPGLDAFPL
jgi:4-carboxymuconolactone decarboxylase